MNINDLPEKTREQLREIMEWTETTSQSQIIIDAVEQHWKAVKRDTFGGEVVLVKASGPGAISYEMTCHSEDLPITRGSGGPPNSAQMRAICLVDDYARRGLFAAVRVALEAAFETVIIEHKEDRS